MTYLFIQNKYFKWYVQMMSNAKQRKLSGYFEEHHILPRALGGDNKKANLVLLTAREHFIAHRLLAKITTGQDQWKMITAAHMMLYDKNNKPERYTPPSKQYEHLKIAFSNAQRAKMLARPLEERLAFGQQTKGYKHTAESLVKMSAGNKGKIISEETRLKASKSNLGKKRSEDTKRKIGLASNGRVQSPLTRSKISDKLIGITRSIETKAKMSAAKAGWCPSKQTRSAMSLAKLGTTQSEETKTAKQEAMLLHYATITKEECIKNSEAISKGKTGKPNGHLGTKRSPEAKERLRIARLKWWADKKAKESESSL